MTYIPPEKKSNRSLSALAISSNANNVNQASLILEIEYEVPSIGNFEFCEEIRSALKNVLFNPALSSLVANDTKPQKSFVEGDSGYD